ncbi:hypothetical protein JCM11491_005917 [Sporobolomyces phaffii]
MPLLRKKKKGPPPASANSTEAPPLAPPPHTRPSSAPIPTTLGQGAPPSPAATEPIGPPPRSFAELEDLVQEVVSGSWDASIPIQAWRRALNQLAQEAKVYFKEGNIDLAFVRTATVLRLSSQVLPQYHPGWPGLSPTQKVDIAQLASDYSQNYDALKQSLIARSAAHFASVRTTPSNYNPALSLRNTVQPSSMSMQESGKSEEYYRSLLPQATFPTDGKKGKAANGPKPNKLRKAFGMKGRTESQRSVGSSKDMEAAVTRSRLPAPGTEDREGEWDVNEDRATVELATTELPRSLAESRPTSTLPLPGEDDSDYEYEGDDNRTSITYANTASIPPTPDWSQLRSTYSLDPNLPPTHSSPTYSNPVLPGPPHPLPSSYTPAHAAQSLAFSQPSPAIPPFPVRPPLPPTPPIEFRSQKSNGSSTPTYPVTAPVPPKPPTPPVPPQYPLVPTPISTPFSIPASPSLQSERPSSTASATTEPLRITKVVPPLPSAPPNQLPSPSASQFSRGYPETLASPALSTAPSLHRSSSIASVPFELYGLPPRRRSSQCSERRSTRGSGLQTLNEIGEALPEETGSETPMSAEDDGAGTWLARTEAGNPLRPIFLPSRLIGRFLDIARTNTEKNIETCGLLLGRLSRNEFSITTLLIPKQEGTPDTCQTSHEEEQFEFQDANELMTLGWIHTHPTQTAFLSSVDLHMHASHQIMLQEAIAIVCAPQHEPNFGIFRLTDPPGLETIVRCTDRALFHPHPDLPIYTDVDADWGHCRIRDYAFETHDLRSR